MPFSGGTTPALPPVTFFSGIYLNPGFFPAGIVNNTTRAMPFGTAFNTLNFSGYNTLSLYVNITNVPAGNDLAIVLRSYDPSTGLAVPSALGNVQLMDPTADGDYAASLYLPSYYATLTGKILPFFIHNFNLVHTGATGGTISVNAFSVWLTNA